jgi:putative ABC transport system ATP-binding protein
MNRIVEARQSFRKNLPAELKGSIEPYHPDKHNTAATLMDNILLGRIGHHHADAPERIRAIVRDILHELGLYDDAISLGLELNVGVGGRRLTTAQRQKLNLARALLSVPISSF